MFWKDHVRMSSVALIVTVMFILQGCTGLFDPLTALFDDDASDPYLSASDFSLQANPVPTSGVSRGYWGNIITTNSCVVI